MGCPSLGVGAHHPDQDAGSRPSRPSSAERGRSECGKVPQDELD